jgi:hypothetical protein
MDDTIARYLRDLDGELLVSGRERDRILAEAEDELRASEQALIEDGMRADRAAAYTLARFGSPSEAGARFNRTSLRARLHGLPWYIAVFVAVGFVTIGASGLLTSLLTMSFGAAPAPAWPWRYGRGEARLEEFLGSFAEGQPHATLAALLAWGAWLLRRRAHERGARVRLALGLLALAAFGATGLLLIPLGLWQVVRYPGTGGGYWLASGLAAIGALLVYVSWRLFLWKAPASTAPVAA